MASRSPTGDHAVGAGTDRTSRRPGRGPCSDLSRLEGARFPLRRGRSRSHRSSTTWCGRRRARPTSAGRVDVAPVGLRAVADSARLHQVITNLVDNAARHGAPDHPCGFGVRKILMRAQLLLDIHDDGPGIAVADRSRSSNALPAAAPRTAAPGWAWRSRAGRWSCTTGASRWSTRRPAAASGLHCPRHKGTDSLRTSIFRSSRDDACPGGAGVNEEDTMSAPTLTPPHPVPTATCGTGTATSGGVTGHRWRPGRRWPPRSGPGQSRPDRADAAASVAYVLTGAAVAATAFGTVRPRPTPAKLVAVAGVGAAGGGRDPRADWLVALCVVASWVVGSLALVGGWTWTGMMLGALGLWFTPVRLVGWVQRGRSRRGTESRVKPGRIAAVTALSAALVALFRSAVRQPRIRSSGRLFDDLLPDVRVTNPGGRVLLGLLVAGVALAATYLRRRTHAIRRPRPGARQVDRRVGVGGTARAARSAVRRLRRGAGAGAVRWRRPRPGHRRSHVLPLRAAGILATGRGHRAHAARDRRRRAEDRSDRAP